MLKENFSLRGKVVDLVSDKVYCAEVFVEDGIIIEVEAVKDCEGDVYILPGLVDSHVHIESSMLIPSEFATLAVRRGVVATVSDPHEIANVLGGDGVRFMLDNASKVPFKFFFGAPSCVPATPFESSGAVLNARDVEDLLSDENIYFLSEMMNFPGVVYKDPEVMAKLEAAKRLNKPIDGHFPGGTGDELKAYVEAGISTDHECMTLAEAEEKLKYGMKIIIREGSAAKNFEALWPLIDKYPDYVMLCTDDSHPDDLSEVYIDNIVRRAFRKGLNKFNVLRAAVLNAVKHYNLPVGLLQKGDPADMIVVDNLEDFNVLRTYIDGELVFDGKDVLFDDVKRVFINNFKATKIGLDDVKVAPETEKIRVVKAIDGELFTESFVAKPKVQNNNVVSDTENDILKIIVINRYVEKAPVSVGFISGFGIKNGGIASSIAHDSHNIIVVGSSDEIIVQLANRIIEGKGGIAVSDGNEIYGMDLDIGGIMSSSYANKVASLYSDINEKAKKVAVKMNAPFMTLSFMALIVIPELKIYDKGLFDVLKFKDVDLFID